MPKANEDLETLLRKLSSEFEETNALLRALVFVSLSTQKMAVGDRIVLLYNAGLQPGQIARILGISSNNVSVRLSALRKSG